MRVILLKNNPIVYSCNVYLILGDWNRLEDVNTLVDAGTDGFILEEISTISTGVGKRRIEQVILTHEHFDHSGGLKALSRDYRPTIVSMANPGLNYIKAFNSMPIKIGDRHAFIIHTPGHSNDSICIYCPDEKTIFSGDTPLVIRTPGGSYSKEFVNSLEEISRLDIEIIYPGHESPIIKNAGELIKKTMENVNNSIII